MVAWLFFGERRYLNEKQILYYIYTDGYCNIPYIWRMRWRRRWRIVQKALQQPDAALPDQRGQPGAQITLVKRFHGRAAVRVLGRFFANDVDHIVGLDVRDPSRYVAKLTFHRVDIPGADVKPLLEGVDVVVHLASAFDPSRDGIDSAAEHGIAELHLLSWSFP